MTVLYHRVFRATPFLLIPFVVLLLVRNDLNQAGFFDPFIYTAYIHDYADLVGRYGRTYYSTRLAHILPNAAAVALFGERAGYYIIRYIQLVAVTAAIYAIGRRYASSPASWFITLFFSTHVWLLREVLWDHYDGSVVIFALVGLALLLPRNKEALSHIGAGFAFACASNGNPMGLVIALTYAPTWLMERRALPWLSILRSLSAAGFGFAAGYSVLIFSMTRVYPDAGWRFDEVTMDMLGSMLSGGATTWFVSLPSIFLDRRLYETLIFPFFLSIVTCGLLATLRGSNADRWSVAGAAIFALLTTAFFAIFHFVLQWGLLSLHFYLIYTLPAFVFATSAFVGQWRPQRYGHGIAIAVVVFFALHWAFWSNAHRLFLSPSEHAPLFLPVAISMIAVAFISLVWLAIIIAGSVRTLTPAVLFLAALLSSGAFFLHHDFTLLFGIGDRRQAEWDLRDGSLYLQRFVAERVPMNAPIRFWYGTRDPYLNSVQSTHLWGFSRLSMSASSDAQMPAIDKGVEERLAPARYVAILGTDAEIEAARAALEKIDLKMDTVARGTFKGRDWPGYDVLLLAIRKN